MPGIREAVLSIVGFAICASSAHGAERSAQRLTVREAADYAIAESGARRDPAWSSADESASVKGQRLTAQVLGDPLVRRRLANAPLLDVCGMKAEARESTDLQLISNASILNEKVTSSKSPQTDDLRRASMVALNRIESYSEGYNAGARDIMALVSSISPETKVRLCEMVVKQMR
jgi:hypothetical protein